MLFLILKISMQLQFPVDSQPCCINTLSLQMSDVTRDVDIVLMTQQFNLNFDRENKSIHK